MAEQLSTEPPSPPHDTPAEKLPLASVLTYAPPIVGASAMLFFVTFFVMNFGTDYLGFAPAAIGTV